MGKPVFVKLRLTDIIVHPSKKLLFTCSKNYCLPVHKHCSPVQKIIAYLSRNIVHLSKKCIGSLIFPPRAVSKTAMQFTYYCSFEFLQIFTNLLLLFWLFYSKHRNWFHLALLHQTSEYWNLSIRYFT